MLKEDVTKDENQLRYGSVLSYIVIQTIRSHSNVISRLTVTPLICTFLYNAISLETVVFHGNPQHSARLSRASRRNSEASIFKKIRHT